MDDVNIARLAGRLRAGLRLFRKITGLAAVSSVVTPRGGADPRSTISPPVHPRCAKQLRSICTAPCREQWLIHLRSGRRSATAHSHTCPVGLQCSCVPIQFDGHLIAVAKLVVGPETSARAFSTATTVLNLITAKVCQDALVSELAADVRALRQSVSQLQQIQSKRPASAHQYDADVVTREAGTTGGRQLTLVQRALRHVHQHYQSPALSLTAMAESLGCNPKYLTSCFTRTVGEHMHLYLVRLRVAHACRLLIDAKMPIKAIAYEAGFRGNGELARAFRRHVGVAPGEYRRIFGAH